jgi:hypothetical protein
MKLKMIGYWVTTAVVALELLAGGVTDLFHGTTSVVSGEPVVQILASTAPELPRAKYGKQRTEKARFLPN